MGYGVLFTSLSPLEVEGLFILRLGKSFALRFSYLKVEIAGQRLRLHQGVRSFDYEVMGGGGGGGGVEEEGEEVLGLSNRGFESGIFGGEVDSKGRYQRR
jgi:hypothetical protein